jgi:hypothetical protein
VRVDKESGCLIFVQRVLHEKTEHSSFLFSILKSLKKDSPLVNSFIRHKCDKELEAYLKETQYTFPCEEFIYECRQSLQKSVIFLHKIFDFYIEHITDNFSNPSPQDLLFHHLYYGSTVTLTPNELLSLIKTQYPDYRFHPSIDVNHQYSVSNIDYSEPLESIDIVSSSQNISFIPSATSKELQSLYFLLPEVDFFLFTVKEKIKDKVKASIQLFNTHEALCGEEGIDIQLSCINDLNGNDVGSFKADLREALFLSNDIPKEYETDFFNAIISVVFKGGLTGDWVIFKSTNNNEFFLVDYIDYLWIAFNDKTLDVIIISKNLYP